MKGMIRTVHWLSPESLEPLSRMVECDHMTKINGKMLPCMSLHLKERFDQRTFYEGNAGVK